MPISRLLPLLVFFSVQPNQQSLGSELEEAMGRKNPAILIIGSGISGIGAAEKLYQNGFRNIRILEATGRTGGRIQTQSFAKGLVEIGAQWIHGPSPENPVFQLSAQYNLLGPDALLEENQKMDAGGHPPEIPVLYTSSGKKISPPLVMNLTSLYFEWLENARNFTKDTCSPDASVGSFLRQEIFRGSKEWDKDTYEHNMAVLRSFLNIECCVSGTHTMDHVALCPYGEYTMFLGLDCTFPKGFESLVNRIKANIPNDTVTLNKAVKRISWDGSFQGNDFRVYPVQVQCEDGDTFVADHVIVTVPLGFLKKHANDFLSPPLPPSKIQAIKKLGFGTNNKILLEFEKPFWEPNSTYIQLVWEGSSPFTEPQKDLKKNWMKKLSGFVVLEPPEQPGHVLCGFIAGEESEYMESLSDEEVLSTMTSLLRQFTGNPELPPPISIMRSKWHSHPYTYGSYSYVAVGSSGSDIDNLAEPLPKDLNAAKPLQVLFAGEATERNFYSTTHGALMSGRREAQRLIDRYPEPGTAVSKAKL
ncbi:peroxisomal N(1)-acetyl-spermine/spermidine oxidase [Rana temporaria]|uniref:peroxisomal N(1)-acetyl-spermine/spermidine oxidase n=1 Tax=Rana temporaria TaxID=8407 RepID=UPI001AAD2A27|nr:peroxisomal N(1)-acetyl-spermine/spermidine oxidase [Rana temporaria]